ncbi:hypothetical protein PQQ59_17550 [Paraburkholderia aspalathi]|uniref:hypothetical protein n=1 Tax=Paraburkholderia aspalathi TaxID=1324617 RepID=UPI0038B6F122
MTALGPSSKTPKELQGLIQKIGPFLLPSLYLAALESRSFLLRRVLLLSVHVRGSVKLHIQKQKPRAKHFEGAGLASHNTILEIGTNGVVHAPSKSFDAGLGAAAYLTSSGCRSEQRQAYTRHNWTQAGAGNVKNALALKTAFFDHKRPP